MDWYVENGYGTMDMGLHDRFESFLHAIHEPHDVHYDDFKDIDLKHTVLAVTLANQKQCQTEVVSLELNAESLSENRGSVGQHVVYFTGAGSQYQNCFRDLAQAVKSTGASYYAFEYPGMTVLGGEVLEKNDMVNTGIAVVNHLLNTGVAVDDMVLQGDSFGSAVAYQVKQELMKQCGVNIRVIMNNGFNRLEQAVCNMIGYDWYTWPIRAAINPFLHYTGWDSRPGDAYGTDTVYQMHVNHVGDQTLGHCTLANRVEMNEATLNFVDPCEAEYRAKRDLLKPYRWASLTHKSAEELTQQFGMNAKGEIDSHLAGLCQLHYPETGEGPYETLISQYLHFSHEYITNHPQTMNLNHLPQPLLSEASSMASLIHGFFARGKHHAPSTTTVSTDRLPSTSDATKIFTNES